MLRTLLSATCAALLTLGAAGAPRAQVPAQNFFPAPGGSNNFVHVDGAWTLPHLLPTVGLYLDYANDPLVLVRTNPEEKVAFVEHMLQAHLLGAIGLWDRLEVGIGVPVSLFQKEGDNTDNLAVGKLASTVMGDLRLVPKLRLHGDNEAGAGLALLTVVTLPTGSEDDFQSYGGVTAEPRLAFEYRFGNRFRAAANLGYLFKPKQTFFNIETAREITYGLGLELAVKPERWAILGEAHGRAALDGRLDKDRISAEEFPFEVAVAGRYWPSKPHALTLGVGGGVGNQAGEGYGTPLVRVFAGYMWQPEREEEPRPQDNCPSDPNKLEPGVCGCGKPDVDSDGDGTLDCQDGCPRDAAKTEPGVCGCGTPDVDTDGDGTLDCQEACPNDPKKTEPGACGCGRPDVDTDGDGIPDCKDDCPKDPTNKCKTKVDPCAIVIGDKVHFDYDKDTIKAVSFPILDAVADILKSRPEIEEVEVQGHTDWDGTDAYNDDLSNRRAAAVVRYLVDKGVERSRLKSKGYGEKKPIDTNETPAGRANNRRVEFIFTKCLREGTDGPTQEKTR